MNKLICVLLGIGFPFSCGGREGASPTSPLLVAGGNHTVAIKKDGTLWAWGLNQDGQLRNGTNKNSHTPAQIDK